MLEGALVDDAVKRLADLLNHVTAEALKRAVALLRQVEWVKQYHEGEWVHRCPVCGAVREDRGDHTAWCDLAAFVSAYPERTP